MLTASSFPSNFGIVETVPLDDQVDAQPLVVPGSQIANGGITTDDVVYVATESNTVYAIDASTGATLRSRNLGSPVPSPLGCFNNGPNVGITGTPVIDLSSQTLFVIADVNTSPTPTYYLHALDLSTLMDKIILRRPVSQLPHLIMRSTGPLICSTPRFSANGRLWSYKMVACMLASVASVTTVRTNHEAGFWDGTQPLSSRFRDSNRRLAAWRTSSMTREQLTLASTLQLS